MNRRENIVKEVNEQIEKSNIENERLSLGYSRAAWKKVKRCHVVMNEKLSALLTNFFVDSAVFEINSDSHNLTFERYEKQWKNFIKGVILNAYPGGDTSTVRNRLLDQFKEKVDVMVAKKEKQIKNE